MEQSKATQLEAVYYGSPIPRGKAELTLLGLVFDRIHFPNVQLPYEGVDLGAVKKEIQRIESHKLTDYETTVLLGALRALPHVPDLRQFCDFSGNFESIFAKDPDPEAASIVQALQDAVYGPTPKGFIPLSWPASHKAIPGDSDSISLNYAGTVHYPALAMMYASRRGLPLVNDSNLPVPALAVGDVKNNAKALATKLAMECVSFALPNVPPLTPREIVLLREELKGTLQDFRTSVLKLAIDLNLAIASDAAHEDIIKAAKFIVTTSVHPALEELKSNLDKPVKGIIGQAWEVAKQVPVIETAYTALGWPGALVTALVAAGTILNDTAEARQTKMAARTGFYYLLRLQQAAAKPR